MEGEEWECENCSADNQVCQCYLNEVTVRVQELEAKVEGVKESLIRHLEDKNVNQYEHDLFRGVLYGLVGKKKYLKIWKKLTQQPKE